MARRRKRGSRRGYKKHRRAGKKKFAILPLLPVYGPTFQAITDFSAGRGFSVTGQAFMRNLTGVDPISRSVNYATIGQQGMLLLLGWVGHKAAAPLNRRLPKWIPIRL